MGVCAALSTRLPLGAATSRPITRQRLVIELPEDPWEARGAARGSAQPLASASLAPPPTRNCRWAALSGSAQPLAGTTVSPAREWPLVNERPLVGHSAPCWWNGGHSVESEVRVGSSLLLQCPPALLVAGQRGSWGPQGTAWELCPAGPQSPCWDTQWPYPKPWGDHEPLPPSPPLWPNGSSCPHWTESTGPAPAIGVAWGARGPVGLWVPGFLSDESWVGPGDLALRELLTDICLLLARTGTSEGRAMPFLVRTGNNIRLVEIYRNIVTWPWPWPDLKNKGSNTRKFATTNHTPPSPLLEKLGFAESFWWVQSF